MAREREYSDIIERSTALKNRVLRGLEMQIQNKRGCYYSATIPEMHRLRELHLFLKGATHIGEAGKATDGYLKELGNMLDKLAVRTSGMRGVKTKTKDTLELLAADTHEWADIIHKLVMDADYAERMQQYHKTARGNQSFRSTTFQPNALPVGAYRRRGSYGIGYTKLG